MTEWTPLHIDEIAEQLADWLAGTPGVVRVAVDGAPATDPDGFAARVLERLRTRGRPAAQVVAATFWRDASLRLEYGREDVESYLSWLDAGALRREVLDAATAAVPTYLPALRDPVANRSIRVAPEPVPDGLVLLVSGSLLLRHGLPFDRTIHLTLSAGALRRRTPPDDAWTLPAYSAYEAEVHPVAAADVVVKLDDPRHPAVRRN